MNHHALILRKENRIMVQAPKGYKNQSIDPVGMWDAELAPAIHFIPFGAKLFDSNLDENKPSCLVLGRLVDDAKLRLKVDDENTEVTGKAGDVVGVWYKSGMRAILAHEGHKVWMSEAGEKNVGKPSPMKLYNVLSPDNPNTSLLPILEDARDRSLGMKTPFDKAKKSHSEPGDELGF